jgi:uncharacterized protein YeaO (DUF488 family)
VRKGRRPSRAGIQTRRAYAPAGPSDGYRVLLDRLWPRGVTKDELALDLWAKELAPSDELRRWFGHDPRRWKGFVERYRRELRVPAARERLAELATRAAQGAVTIVYGARDERYNNATVVRGEIERLLRARRSRSGRPRAV